MSSSQVIIIAPATTANLGPGFDVFGLALEKPQDEVGISVIPENVVIEVAGMSASSIPTSPEKNSAGIVAQLMLEEFQVKKGMAIKIDKGIVPGMGLGSSAASAAAVALGINHLFNLHIDKKNLVQWAAKGERASAGYEHADNVSAALCGGFVIVRSYKPLEIINLKAPNDMEVCVCYPNMTTPTHKTEKARAIVPKKISIDQLVRNVGSAAALASGFAEGDIDMIGASMSDAVVEPERAALIPGYQTVKENALEAGACGVAISGAGPAMIAIVDKRKANSGKVADAMKAGFESSGLRATSFATKPGKGAYLLEKK
ncbi:TPA: homoserine kinase [Candidatus Bathyarchaeota archaeon]|nr:homoserine kinase [Candidatus Bathyarchaeota archaeon]